MRGDTHCGLAVCHGSRAAGTQHPRGVDLGPPEDKEAAAPGRERVEPAASDSSIPPQPCSQPHPQRLDPRRRLHPELDERLRQAGGELRRGGGGQVLGRGELEAQLHECAAHSRRRGDEVGPHSADGADALQRNVVDEQGEGDLGEESGGNVHAPQEQDAELRRGVRRARRNAARGDEKAGKDSRNAERPPHAVGGEGEPQHPQVVVQLRGFPDQKVM